MTINKPIQRPFNPSFSSGPCAKRPGWTTNVLSNAFVGRSHRSKDGRERLNLAITKTKALLQIPGDYRVAIVPGSDTGAFEMAMWNMLGARGVDVLAWESFGKGWLIDAVKHLKLTNVRALEAVYGALPDLSQIDFNNDVVFTWNGTTSGVRVPNGNWIPNDRQGLTFADATSAVFAQAIDWPKVDVLTYSWQKVLGGEASHGMLVLSPRAVERLENYTPPWPLPKVFRLTKGGKFESGIFAGETINTPSMLCVEDYLDALAWAESAGGLDGVMARSDANARVIFDWIARTPWVENLAVDKQTWSNTSVCLRIDGSGVEEFPDDIRSWIAKDIVSRLEKERVAYDIGSYRDAPAGLRIWTGATVEAADLQALTLWLDWAFAEAKSLTLRDDRNR